MRLLTGFKLAAFTAALAAVLAVQADTPPAMAQELPPEQIHAQQEQHSENSNAYTYIAQPGDSYSQMARKAIQTYGIVHNITMSPAAIVFAETGLTQAKGSPLLTEGQEIVINETDVQHWVEAAQNLSQDQQAAWAYYAQFADFNTNAVGEVKE